MRSAESLVVDTAPFPDSLIQQLPPRGDDYVPWYEYAQRVLLQHPDHSYRVTGVWQATNMTVAAEKGGTESNRDSTMTTTVTTTWAVTVEFEIDGSVYGGGGEDSSPAAAESNAYKRALAHAGIGLHLYNRKGYWLHGRLEQGDEPDATTSAKEEQGDE